MRVELGSIEPTSTITLSTLAQKFTIPLEIEPYEIEKNIALKILYSAFNIIKNERLRFNIFFTGKLVSDIPPGIYSFYSKNFYENYATKINEEEDEDFFKIIISSTAEEKKLSESLYIGLGALVQNVLLESSLQGLGVILNLVANDSLNINKNRILAEILVGKPKFYIENIAKMKKTLFRYRKYILPIMLNFNEKSLEEILLKNKDVQLKARTITLYELSYLLRFSLSFLNNVKMYIPAKGYNVEAIVFLINTDILPKGKYLYDDTDHAVILLEKGDFTSFFQYITNKSELKKSSAIIVLASKNINSESLIEAGMIAQNIYLAATSVSLRSVKILDFHKKVLKEMIETELNPILLNLIG